MDVTCERHYTFLIDHDLIEGKGFDRAKCAVYNEAVKADQIDKMSLIFATGYFGNPSSCYGYVLLQAGSGDTRV